MTRRFIVAIAALVSSQSLAAPSVFIPADSSAWWTADKAQGRVLGSSAGSVTAEKLSSCIEATEIYDTYKVCSLASVAHDTFVGLGKKTQDEIGQTVRGIAWRLMAEAPGGRRFLAQSVLYEACNDAENRGGAVLVTDARTGEIMMFERMGIFTTNSGPIWTAFLSLPAKEDTDPPLFSYSHCTECGVETHIYYDVTRKKLYTEYNGH
jgi:hypothetical protein